MNHQKTAIVLFDGVCNFCSASVQWIIRHDPHGYFQFASLQSSVGKKLLAGCSACQNADSIVLIEDDHYYMESTAVLRIAKHLTGLWRFAYVFIVVPKTVRDFVYRYVARRRYRWFGKVDLCQ